MPEQTVYIKEIWEPLAILAKSWMTKIKVPEDLNKDNIMPNFEKEKRELGKVQSSQYNFQIQKLTRAKYKIFSM